MPKERPELPPAFPCQHVYPPSIMAMNSNSNFAAPMAIGLSRGHWCCDTGGYERQSEEEAGHGHFLSSLWVQIASCGLLIDRKDRECDHENRQRQPSSWRRSRCPSSPSQKNATFAVHVAHLVRITRCYDADVLTRGLINAE